MEPSDSVLDPAAKQESESCGTGRQKGMLSFNVW
eukprot:COSAG06_NODE_63933_length_261_cov_0.586420_1_plen_33_part_10